MAKIVRQCSYSLLAGSALAYEKYVPEQISALEPQPVPGLDAYGIDYFLDLPLTLTSRFFFEQVLDKTSYTYHQESVLAEHDVVPNWVLWFTADFGDGDVQPKLIGPLLDSEGPVGILARVIISQLSKKAAPKFLKCL